MKKRVVLLERNRIEGIGVAGSTCCMTYPMPDIDLQAFHLLFQPSQHPAWFQIFSTEMGRGRDVWQKKDLFLFGCGMSKFLGQKLNRCHSSDLSHSGDNAESLTHCATRELKDKDLNPAFIDTSPRVHDLMIQLRRCVIAQIECGSRASLCMLKHEKKGPIHTEGMVDLREAKTNIS